MASSYFKPLPCATKHGVKAGTAEQLSRHIRVSEKPTAATVREQTNQSVISSERVSFGFLRITFGRHRTGPIVAQSLTKHYITESKTISRAWTWGWLTYGEKGGLYVKVNVISKFLDFVLSFGSISYYHFLQVTNYRTQQLITWSVEGSLQRVQIQR